MGGSTKHGKINFESARSEINCLFYGFEAEQIKQTPLINQK
jgi:hypothetical protein